MSRNNIFLKSSLALAVASATNMMASSAVAAPLVISKTGQINGGLRNGDSGQSAAVKLDKHDSGFFSSARCNSSSKTCSFENRGDIYQGNASSGLEVQSSAWYSLNNTGTISSTSGAAIRSKPDAGDFYVFNSGSLTSDSGTAIDHQSNSIFGLTSSGTISGDINIAVENNNSDTISFIGGSYTGTIGGAEQVTVRSGRVNMNGTVNLNSNGPVPLFKVFSDGSLQTSGLMIDGADVYFDAGSQLFLDVETDNRTTDSGIPVVNAENNRINANGTIVVLPEDTHETGFHNYVLLQDSGAISSETPTLEVMDLYTVSKNTTASTGDKLVATVTRIEDKTVGEIVEDAGGSEDEVEIYDEAANAAEEAAEDTSTEPSPDDGMTRKEKGEKLQDNIQRQYTPKASARLAAELLPTLNRASVDHALKAVSVANKAMLNRMDNQANGISTGDGMNRHAFWIQGLHNEAHQDDRQHHNSTIRGYHSRLSGITMGFDIDTTDQGVVGFAASYAQGDINKNDVEDETSVDTYLATLYGRWPMGEGFSLDMFLNYGMNKNDRKRVFDVPGTDLNPAKSEFDSQQIGFKSILSRTLNMGEWELSPMLGYHYSHFEVDEYTETGSAAALKVGKQTYKVNEVGAGLGLSKTFTGRWGDLKPEIKVMGWHDFATEAVETTSQFVIGGNTFVSEGAEPEKTTWNATAGVTWEGEVFEMSLGYERNWRDGYHSDSAYARMELKF